MMIRRHNRYNTLVYTLSFAYDSQNEKRKNKSSNFIDI